MTPHIHRRSFGSGPHHILAIHCTLAHSGAWRGLATALGEAFTVHAFDLPNHGNSGDWDGQGDLHDAATDMARSVMDDIGPAPLDVIGHSFGATVALRIAVETPQRLRRAVLFEPVYFAAALADDPTFKENHQAINADYETAYTAGRYEEATRTFNRLWAGAGRWDTLSEKTRAYMTQRIGFVHHSGPFLIDDCRDLLAPGRMDGAQVPILLLRGAASPWAEAINGSLLRRLPDARDVSIDGTGHMGPITAPDAVAAHARDFLRP